MTQTRLCLNLSYDELHRMANSDKMFREIMGIETEYGFERIEFEYQNILDNVTLSDDETVRKRITPFVMRIAYIAGRAME